MLKPEAGDPIAFASGPSKARAQRLLEVIESAKAEGITIGRIAEACGVSSQAVSQWVRSGRIQKTNLWILGDMTGYSQRWLVDGTLPKRSRDLAATAMQSQRATVLAAMYDRLSGEHKTELWPTLLRLLSSQQKRATTRGADVSYAEGISNRKTLPAKIARAARKKSSSRAAKEEFGIEYLRDKVEQIKSGKYGELDEEGVALVHEIEAHLRRGPASKRRGAAK